jgi:hypothetical protein
MKQIAILATLAMAASGCATITRGTSEAFTVESEAPGAQVQTSNGLSCIATPCTFGKVKRNSDFTVTVSMEGYVSTTHNVTHQTSGGGGAGMAGNVLLGGLIGAVVDANNGATQELVPNPLRVTLRRSAPPAAAAPAAVNPVAEAAPAAAAEPVAEPAPAGETPPATTE